MLAGHQAYSWIRLAQASPNFWGFPPKMSFSLVPDQMRLGPQLVEYSQFDRVFHHEFWSGALNPWLFWVPLAHYPAPKWSPSA
jgi:hypothetical protein